MRVLLENYGDVRVFKDRNILGVPRFIIETIDPDFGFRNEQTFSCVWYNKKRLKALEEIGFPVRVFPSPSARSISTHLHLPKRKVCTPPRRHAVASAARRSAERSASDTRTWPSSRTRWVSFASGSSGLEGGWRGIASRRVTVGRSLQTPSQPPSVHLTYPLA